MECRPMAETVQYLDYQKENKGRWLANTQAFSCSNVLSGNSYGQNPVSLKDKLQESFFWEDVTE